MTKRIFWSIFAAALCIFLATAVLFFGVLYQYFSDVQLRQLRVQTELAAQGTANEGAAYFDGLTVEHYRITWIDAGGDVLYDSESDSEEMENHLQREEIQQAFLTGSGESQRYSETLLERSIYCAKRLPDGTVLRLCVAQNSLFTLILGMLQPMCVIFAATLILALVLASRLSKSIVKPLNEVNLDAPMENQGYDELAPLLHRIAEQQRKIRSQSEELRRKRDEFDTVTSQMNEGIVLLNDKKVILSINPAAVRLLEAGEDCEGKFLLTLNHSLSLQTLLQQAGDGQRAEATLEVRDRRYRLEANPVFSGERVSGMVLLMLDVTEKERTEQLRREFTANVSHELRTPLQTISGSAELLAGGMVKPEDVPQFSKQIYSEAQRMIRLVEDIIKLSHLDEGAEDMTREPVELLKLAREVVSSLMPAAEAAGVELTLTGQPVTVNGIRQLLEGIVYNLCDNAIKYNRRGGSVKVELSMEGQRPVLAVADTGIGIPPEHQERIFERFYRVDKSRSKQNGGTGLGLSIVKHAARLHNAELSVRSQIDCGTTITVRFPAQEN